MRDERVARRRRRFLAERYVHDLGGAELDGRVARACARTRSSCRRRCRTRRGPARRSGSRSTCRTSRTGSAVSPSTAGRPARRTRRRSRGGCWRGLRSRSSRRSSRCRAPSVIFESLGAATTSFTFQLESRPFGLSSGVNVVIQRIDSSTRNPNEARRRHEEAEARAEVGREQQVHRPAEQADRGQHDEDAEDRRVPQRLVPALLGEQRQGQHRQPPRSSWWWWCRRAGVARRRERHVVVRRVDVVALVLDDLL